ncbi:MAG: M48 family metallopeptidase [Dehalococcoidia bacterium]|nr:M48 family metallopeptidase [Dehalococcoidia bacterium]
MIAAIKRNRRLTLIGEGEVDLMGRPVGYRLKQSQRARGIRLEIRSETGLTVVVPGRYTQRQVLDILRQKSRWILRHLPSDAPLQLPLFTPEPGQGDKLYFMGRQIEINVSTAKSAVSSAVLDGNKLLISAGSRNGAIPAILERWYRQQATTVFAQKAAGFQEAMGLHYNSILIRGQKTRWGSCSPAGNLTLNWKLLMAPEEIIDYVVIHELTHLRHMNHSKKFWDMVEQYCPNWRKYRKWLVTHEDELKARASFKL